MDIKKLSTKAENTWCPGCLNNAILLATKQALASLIDEKKIRQQDIVTVSGIGCHGKIYDYLNTNGFYSIHGRTLPTTLGIKVANPKLTVLGFGGDGDTYAEGMGHFIHACRYNADVTMIVHNNQVFALTVGQATPTSEKGFVTGAMPEGEQDMPLNPLLLALSAGATFVARTYALDVPYLSSIIRKAILHKGFAFVDVLQPCLTFHNTIHYFSNRVYKLGKDYNPSNLQLAMEKAREWNYNFDEKERVPLGIFYEVERPTFDEKWGAKAPLYKRKLNFKFQEVVKEFK